MYDQFHIFPFQMCMSMVAGVERFGRDIEMMLGRPPSLLMKLCWCFVTPALMLVSDISIRDRDWDFILLFIFLFRPSAIWLGTKVCD